MEVRVEHIDGVKFSAATRGHQVICDQPESNGGVDAGMTPPEFLLVSLGTCAGFYAAQYLKTRGLPTTGLAIEVHAEKAMQPARIGSFRIEILLPDLADREKHEPGILRAVKACLVHNTLIHEPGIETVLKLG